MIRVIREIEKRLKTHSLTDKEYNYVHDYVIEKIPKLYGDSGVNYLDPKFTLEKVLLGFDLLNVLDVYNYPIKVKNLVFLAASSEAYKIISPIKKAYKETPCILDDKFGFKVAEPIFLTYLDLDTIMTNIDMVDIYGIMAEKRNATIEEMFVHDLDILRFYMNPKKASSLFYKDYLKFSGFTKKESTKQTMESVKNILKRRYGKYGERRIVMSPIYNNQVFSDKIKETKDHMRKFEWFEEAFAYED